MVATPRYAVQTFVRDRRGGITANRSIACKNADEARSRAERHCSGKDNVGAAAFLLRGDEYIGDTEAPIAIAVFGHVPVDITDDIPF